MTNNIPADLSIEINPGLADELANDLCSGRSAALKSEFTNFESAPPIRQLQKTADELISTERPMSSSEQICKFTQAKAGTFNNKDFIIDFSECAKEDISSKNIFQLCPVY